MDKLAHSKALKVAILAILVLNTSSICNEKQVFIIGKTGKPKCVACPSSCSVCYRNLDNKPTCISCEEGFYLDINSQCQPCNHYCAACIGPNQEQCSTLKKGYFLNTETSEIEACNDASCAQCYGTDECRSCKEGFFSYLKGKNKSGMNIVGCTACDIDNCMMCEKKADKSINAMYMSCAVCAERYGLINDKCEKCPDNCQFCHEESKECAICTKGFFIDRKTGKCVRIPVSDCYSMQDSKTCSYCESHYFLKDNKCLLCRDKVDNCSFCGLNGDEVNCMSCEIGFHRSGQGKCEKCIENCNHCSKERCVVCRHGYYYDQAKDICESCKLDNCRVCESADTCSDCEAGFFYNSETRKCEKCAENCLKCADHADNCISCPVTYYSLQDQVVTSGKPEEIMISSMLSMFLGMKLNIPMIDVMGIKTVNKCFKKCPKTYRDKEVLVNDAERKCVMKVTDSAVESLNMPVIKEAPDILTTLMALKTQYDDEIRNVELKTDVKKIEGRDKECNFNGNLKKEIRGNYESFYICRCEKEFLGDNCQITSTLYQSIQNRLVDIINEIQKRFMNSDKYSERIFLKAFLLINKFKVGRGVIEKMMDLTKAFIKIDRDVDNKKKLYMLYDALLLNLFDLSEDSKKLTYYSYNLDWDLEKEKTFIFEDIHTLLDMLESSLEDLDYSNSFLADEAYQYVGMDTFSYVFSEFKYSRYDPRTGFTVSNPNIDTSFNNINNNTIIFTFDDMKSATDSRFNLQIINFAALLFEDRMNQESNVLVSNMLYIKNIDPEAPHQPVVNANTGAKTLRITFAMNFIPAFEDILRNIYCKAFNFKNHILDKKGTPVSFDDDEQTVVCDYKLDFEVANYYFGAVILK